MAVRDATVGPARAYDPDMDSSNFPSPEAAEAVGMATAHWARVKPGSPAVYDRNGVRTFAEVNARANQIVRHLRRCGVAAGEHVALLCSNRAEVMEVFAATLRGGYRLIPVNWRLTEGEIAYILDNSEATALFAEAGFEAGVGAALQQPRLKTRLAMGGAADGFQDYGRTLDRLDDSDIPDPQIGHVMFYTSGTTGRPKGVYRPKLSDVRAANFYEYGGEHNAQLCVCPTYHGSGLSADTRAPMVAGVPVVYVERWDSEAVLRTIQERRITHAHMVPIMFQRLLAVPEAVRRRYDLSSLKGVVHGAAPCPPDVKRAMIDWLGPIIREYYGGTEGAGGFVIASEDWLEHPGSVGRKRPNSDVRILTEDGETCGPGERGMIYFRRLSDSPFEYYKDPKKTAQAHRGEYFTVGDIGYFDEDDYLYLTGRSADCIIAGGVNIYPQEIDNEILKHPAVEDCATIGAPNSEWGEEVKAVVMLRPGFAASEALAGEIIASLEGVLADYKRPRTVDFVSELPRNAAGKIERRRVRAPYWAGRASEI
jgi:long-chain acyl-CoA synthetase